MDGKPCIELFLFELFYVHTRWETQIAYPIDDIFDHRK